MNINDKLKRRKAGTTRTMFGLYQIKKLIDQNIEHMITHSTPKFLNYSYKSELKHQCYEIEVFNKETKVYTKWYMLLTDLLQLCYEIDQLELKLNLVTKQIIFISEANKDTTIDIMI